MELHDIKLDYDELVTIAIGRSRRETNWRNVEMQWSDFVNRLSKAHYTAETYAEYIKSPKSRQDEIKDVGGFVAGVVNNGKRNNRSIMNRQIITLDIDNAVDFKAWDDFKLLYGNAAVIYTTHKHLPEKSRYRLCVLLDRPVFADEYEAIARKIAEHLGMNQFDPTTFQPARLMFWQSTSKDGEYVFDYINGEPLGADGILNSYRDWRDTSSWAVSEGTTLDIRKEIKKQGDPEAKTGIIGAFCRTYDIHEAIEKFLPDTYKACDMPNRYTYIEGSTSAGLVVYDDKFAYSHHGTDPASGKLCNAFDLVRIHKFGLKDEDAKENTPTNKLPSFKEMNEFCRADPAVVSRVANEQIESAMEDFDDEFSMQETDTSWWSRLKVNKKGEIESSLRNLILILEKDPALKNIVFNLLSDNLEKKGKVPWNSPGHWWRDADDSHLVCYIDRKYTSFSARNYHDALIKVADDRACHPVREFLSALPNWDGIRRLDRLLVEYLGARDNAYTRAVIRKMLCAAIARVMLPGCKFDCIAILCGPQGIGKSTFIAKLAGQWFNDSLQLSDTQDKTAAEKLQGYWIMEIGELAGLRKAEVETLKSFISRQDDIYRASFGKHTTPHKRQCVFFGTTNAEGGYLRDITGNRRFWPVTCSSDSQKKPWDLTQEVINQIWAEALIYYNAGEKLYLEGEAWNIAEKEQRAALESDDREGMIREYLDTLLPDNWKNLDLYQRRQFLNGDITCPAGTIKREYVCAQEIWAECFQKPKADLKNTDSAAINLVMSKISEWEKLKTPHTFPVYGSCRGYKRTTML